MLTCFTNDATVSIVVVIGHSLSVWWFSESLYTKIFSKPPVVIKVELLFSVFIEITVECCAIMMWCYDLVLEKLSLICVSTRHFYSCIARKRRKNAGTGEKNVCTIFTLSYFSISFRFCFVFFFAVPVDLMFITMSWIFFHYETAKKNRKKMQKRKGSSNIKIQNLWWTKENNVHKWRILKDPLKGCVTNEKCARKEVNRWSFT